MTTAISNDYFDHQLQVLVVDDSASSREHLRQMLTTMGHHPTVLGSAKEALAVFDHKAFDLVLCDLVMPQIDGIGLLKLVRARKMDMPFIIITAHASLKSAMTALREGADDYLRRPVTEELLDHRIRAVYGRTLLALETAKKHELRTALATAGGAAHELNQPLMALMASAELIGKVKDQNRIKALAVTVVDQASRLGEITARLTKLTTFKTKPYMGASEIVDLEASAAGPASSNETSR